MYEHTIILTMSYSKQSIGLEWKIAYAPLCIALIFTVEYSLNEWHVSRRFVIVVSQFLRDRPSPEGRLDVPRTREKDLSVSPRGPRRHTMAIKKKGMANKGRNDLAIGNRKFDICCHRCPLCPPLIYNSVPVVCAVVISARWNIEFYRIYTIGECTIKRWYLLRLPLINNCDKIFSHRRTFSRCYFTRFDSECYRALLNNVTFAYHDKNFYIWLKIYKMCLIKLF